MEPTKNPYDFLNEPAGPAKQPFNFGGGDTKSRIIQVAIVGGVILIVLIIFFNLVLGNKKSTADLLYEPAAQQADLIEITKIGTEKVHDSKANLKMTTANALLSSQSFQTNEIIKKGGGGKSASKKIAIFQDKKYEEVLTEAESSGKYEETFLALYANRLDAYKAKLESAYAATSGQTKEDIGKMYNELEAISLTNQAEGQSSTTN